MDDIVITSNDQDGIRKLKQHLFIHFQTKDLGKVKYLLGIEIAQSKSGVVMCQRKYVLNILEEIGMLDCKLRGVYSISTFNDFYRLFLSDRLSWILMDFDGFIQSS